MAVAFVGSSVNQAYATTVTTTRTTTGGNTLVALVEHQGRTGVTMTDTAGNTWVAAFNTNSLPATSNRLVSVWYCIGATAITSATATFTSGATSAITLTIMEVSGVATLRAANGVETGTDPKVANVSATAGDFLCSIASGPASVDMTASTGYTKTTTSIVSTTYVMYAYRTAAATASQGATWTGSGTTGTITVAFAPPVTNDPPVANAGPAQSVEPWSTVTLTGAASTDSDGTIASYAWAVTAGTSVTLTGAATVSPTFTAPATLAGTTTTLTLTVTDNLGATGTDTVVITSLPVTERAVVGGVQVPMRILAVST